MKKITFILHGKLRKKDQLKNKINQRLSGQFELQYFQTGGPGDGIHLAKLAIEGQTDYLVSVGGDGMLNEVINGCMNCTAAFMLQSQGVKNPARVSNPIIGLLPFGTGNDFSKTIGMRKDIEQLARLIENDQIQPVDIGEVQYISHEGETKTRYFINITDLGIGGEVVKIVNQSSKFLGPHLTYKKAIIQSFFTYKHKKVSLTSDSFQWEGPILSLCMANGRYFGSGICIAPQADVSDGMIQLVIMGNLSLIDYLKNMPKIKRGEILEHPEVHYEQVHTCRIVPLEGECPVDMDGEFIGYAPIELRVHKHALKFLRK
ncbi:MAG: diacylglycerol kinase family lipid kinase [Bacteroidetes bacterium]|nr:diacylglycerol kinase family lipid kinase [Bacteroidota bacterium]